MLTLGFQWAWRRSVTQLLHTFSRVGACSALLRYARRGCGYILPSLHSRPWVCDLWSRWWWCCLASEMTTRPPCGPPTSADTATPQKKSHPLCYLECWLQRQSRWWHLFIFSVGVQNLIWNFVPIDLMLPSGGKGEKSEIKFVWTFIGRRRSYIHALALKQNVSVLPPRGFYNCFYLSVRNTANSFLLQNMGLTAIFNKMYPFILIRDGRLAIDYSSYGNLSDQLNLRLHGLSRFNYPKCNKLKFSGGEEQTLAAAAVVLGSEWSVSFKCTTCDLWLQLISKCAGGGTVREV